MGGSSQVTTQMIPGGTGGGGSSSYDEIQSISKDYMDDITKIIGLPPYAYWDGATLINAERSRILNHMPVVQLVPGWPEFSGFGTGSTLYGLNVGEGKKRYSEICKKCGMNDNDIRLPLKVAFQNDTNFGESFSIEFGDSSFEQMANFGSEKLQELRFITGSDSAAEATTKVGNTIDQSNNLGKAGSGMLGGISKLQDAIKNFADSATGHEGFGEIFEGAKVDFPKIWKGASYTPSYSITVKLVNPFPGSPYNGDKDHPYNKYILEPLIQLLAFCVPISTSSFTYNFPVMARIACPGLFDIRSGYISSIDVVKGGEGNDIRLDQQPNAIDLKITFAEIYSVMMAEADPNSDIATEDAERPILSRYIDNLRERTKGPDYYAHHRGGIPLVGENGIEYRSQGTNRLEQQLRGQAAAPFRSGQPSRISQNDINSGALLGNSQTFSQANSISSIYNGMNFFSNDLMNGFDLTTDVFTATNPFTIGV